MSEDSLAFIGTIPSTRKDRNLHVRLVESKKSQKLSISERLAVDIRDHFLNKESQVTYTQRGVRIPVSEIDELINALQLVKKTIKNVEKGNK